MTMSLVLNAYSHDMQHVAENACFDFCRSTTVTLQGITKIK